MVKAGVEKPLPRCREVAVDRGPDAARAGHEAPHEREVVGVNGVEALLGNPCRRSREPRDAMAVERSGLEVLGVARWLALLEGKHARATTQHRVHVHTRRHGKAARALGAHEGLVPREGHEVNAQLVHADRTRSRRLRAVEKHRRPHAVRGLDHARQLLA